MIERDHAPDAELLKCKNLFAHRCQQAGLPSIPLLAEFADGQPIGSLSALLIKKLISKPSTGSKGKGVESWRYDGARHCFFNAVTDKKLSQSDLLQYFCDLSASERVIVQERFQNHEDLSPLANGTLSNIRILTCRSPSGSIDLMPPVIWVAAGRIVAANLT